MHELAICQALMRQIETIASERNASHLVSIVVLISKSGLLPVLDDFKPYNAKRYLHDIASDAPVLELSSKNNLGMAQWCDWLDTAIAKQNAHLEQHPLTTGRHHHHGEHRHHHHDHNHGGDKHL